MDEAGAVVLDASAMVDMLVGTALAPAVTERLEGCALHAPGHFDADVVSALARLNRAGEVSGGDAEACISLLAEAPVLRHPVPPLLGGAWLRRDQVRIVDALYVELSEQLELPLVTTDARLGRAIRRAETIQ